MICNNCGKFIKDTNAEKCSDCGYKISREKEGNGFFGVLRASSEQVNKKKQTENDLDKSISELINIYKKTNILLKKGVIAKRIIILLLVAIIAALAGVCICFVKYGKKIDRYESKIIELFYEQRVVEENGLNTQEGNEKQTDEQKLKEETEQQKEEIQVEDETSETNPDEKTK